MSSRIWINLDLSKILSSGNELFSKGKRCYRERKKKRSMNLSYFFISNNVFFSRLESKFGSFFSFVYSFILHLCLLLGERRTARKLVHVWTNFIQPQHFSACSLWLLRIAFDRFDNLRRVFNFPPNSTLRVHKKFCQNLHKKTFPYKAKQKERFNVPQSTQFV